ncbi:MAG: hypoxanthine phosphoribosyltransferase [Vampirovibrio sp.]|nr:hypoxanthine phosphoribosyltransferase [Vampirovibrio sp.]
MKIHLLSQDSQHLNPIRFSQQAHSVANTSPNTSTQPSSNTFSNIQPLISQKSLSERVKAMGKDITRHYQNTDHLAVLSVLKGASVFTADLIREINLDPVSLNFIKLSSYGNNTQSNGNVMIEGKLPNLSDKDVLIVEDIMDTGNSLAFLKRYLEEYAHPKSIRTAVMLEKPSRRDPNITLKPDFTGFSIPDRFVVGYGLDYAEKYRHLPYIGVVKPPSAST